MQKFRISNSPRPTIVVTAKPAPIVPSAGKTHCSNTARRREKPIAVKEEGYILGGRNPNTQIVVSVFPESSAKNVVNRAGKEDTARERYHMRKNTATELYRTLLETMNEGVWVEGKDGETLYANPKMCALLGYNLKEIMTRDITDFWDQESMERIRYKNEHERKRGVSSSYEGRIINREGKNIPVLVSGSPLPDGGTMGVVTDVTELKKREKGTAYVLDEAVRNASVAIIILDEEGKITTWNEGAKDLLGYKAAEVVGTPIKNIIPDPKLRLETKHIASIHRMVVEMIHRKKGKLKIGLTFNPIVFPDKSGHAFLLIGRDISVQNRLQEEVESRYNKIKEAYEQMGLVRRQMDYMVELMDSDLSNRKETMNFIITSLIMVSKTDACTVRLYDPQRNVLELVGSYGISEEWKRKISVVYQGSLTEKAFNERKTLRIVNLVNDPLYGSAYLASECGLTSMMVVPFIVKKKLIGEVTMYIGPEKSLDLFENEFIEKYAKLIALIIATLENRF